MQLPAFQEFALFIYIGIFWCQAVIVDGCCSVNSGTINPIRKVNQTEDNIVFCSTKHLENQIRKILE